MMDEKLRTLVAALRCSAEVPPGDDICAGCAYAYKEKIPEEFLEKCGKMEWMSCECDRIAWEAADKLEEIGAKLDEAQKTADYYKGEWERTVKRLEALLAENERLKTGKDRNVPTSAEEAER